MEVKKIIFIADDDADLVQALQLRCEARGLRVRTAFDSLNALNLIHEARPDVICLDVNMPCGNGLSVLEMLGGDDELRMVPAIVMTGDSSEDTIRRCHNSCAYYVEKCADLWSRIEPILDEVFRVARTAAEPASVRHL
jgi:CheY-like chemotaxis protein